MAGRAADAEAECPLVTGAGLSGYTSGYTSRYSRNSASDQPHRRIHDRLLPRGLPRWPHARLPARLEGRNPKYPPLVPDGGLQTSRRSQAIDRGAPRSLGPHVDRQRAGSSVPRQPPGNMDVLANRTGWIDPAATTRDRKSTRLNSSHLGISYA